MMLGQGRGNIFKRSIDKLKEWIVAVKLERNFTKRRDHHFVFKQGAMG